MRKLWAVMRREFVERVRRKWFWFSAILGPVFFAAVFLLPAVFASSGGAKRIAVVDVAGSAFGARVSDALNAGPALHAILVAAGPGVLDSLMREVGEKRLDGVLILTDDVATTGRAEYRASNVSAFRDIQEMETTLTTLVTAVRLERAGIDPVLLSRAQHGITLTTTKISGSRSTGESSAQSFSLAYFMAVILYMAILMYGVNVKSSVLEEKTTRIVEVLVSSIHPFPLLLGKVLGVGAVSLFQFLIWGVAAKGLLGVRAAFRGHMSALDSPIQLFQVPHVSTSTGAIFLAYFLGGFFLYSAMFAAVGAMSSSEQDAQQAQQPIVYVLVLAFLSMFAPLTDPASVLAVTLSLIPFTSPIAMPVRWAAGDLPVAELVASLALLAVAIVAATWVAARIYRVGILMTGKRPSLRELVRWVRAA
jgi:ABC-2 type transport system permease protein